MSLKPIWNSSKVLTKSEVLSAYRAVGSWEKTGRIFGINRGVAYRIATHADPAYTEKVGNKSMELLPIWERIDFENVDIYHILEVAINATKESESRQDPNPGEGLRSWFVNHVLGGFK